MARGGGAGSGFSININQAGASFPPCSQLASGEGVGRDHDLSACRDDTLQFQIRGRGAQREREGERLWLTGFWCPEVLGKRGKPAGFAELINSQEIGIPHSPGISISLSLSLSLLISRSPYPLPAWLLLYICGWCRGRRGDKNNRAIKVTLHISAGASRCGCPFGESPGAASGGQAQSCKGRAHTCWSSREEQCMGGGLSCKPAPPHPVLGLKANRLRCTQSCLTLKQTKPSG